MAGGWRNRHYEELHTLYSSPNIIVIIKSWRIRLAEYVESMRRKFSYRESQKERDH
jgi:uncharacterized protein (DUF486 family)